MNLGFGDVAFSCEIEHSMASVECIDGHARKYESRDM